MKFSAYAEQKETVFNFSLVSCGHIFAEPKREIRRPNGRDDWLLLYIAKGEDTFYFDECVIAKAGSFVIFAPNQKQHHINNTDHTAEFYYVHFKCDNLSDCFALDTSKVYELNFSRQICNVFEEIIEETLNKAMFYEKMCLYKLMHLFCAFEREVAHNNLPEKENYDRVARVIQHINKYYNSDLALLDYAKMCNMSKYHFLRVFSGIVGKTPLEYKNNIRLEHSAELLIDEKLSVEEISFLVGYSSASYFSSAFKKKYGVSPKKYQQRKLGETP
ncbi:MAG: helix-turn-helix transcriptional regulator [Clostridia bacterium]|nr:helix-turn-helix transcriptional regulator [Clostridia bacterium]